MAANLGPTPFPKRIISYLPQRTQLVVPPISGKNHYRFAMHSTGSPHLCFIPMRQYLLMLIGHMSEDDETHF